jgi:dipeptidase
LDEVQVAVVPDVVSLTTVVPAAPEMVPPGLTDHVVAVAAKDVAAPNPMARAAAPAVTKVAAMRLRI